MKRTQMDRRFRITQLITDDAILCLFLIVMVALPIVATGFGFDSANSCTPNGKMSRRGRAQMLAAIPCDLGKQAFCHLPGTAYPWHAVRRFVHENQGLMKRMYGDVRHISILRDEIQNNEVDEDDMEDTAERYSKDGGRRSAKYLMHGRDRDRDRDRDDFVSYKGNDVLMEPHFRPVSTTTKGTTTTTTTTTTTETPTTASTTARSSTTTTTPAATTTTSTSASNSTSTSTTAAAPLDDSPVAPNPDTNSVYEVPSTSTSSSSTPTPGTGDNIQIIDSPQLGLRNLSSESKAAPATPTTLRPSTGNNKSSAATSASRRRKPAEASTISATLRAVPTTTSTAVPATTTATVLIRRNATKASPAVIPSVTTPVSFASLFSGSSTGFSPEKLRRPLTTSTTAAPTAAPASASVPALIPTQSGAATKAGLVREGQLFQDAMKQEPVAVSSNMRGVNACPVKDEVVAPFWANNTRGEVLALLNLYPFEQYVHWEKCTQEFKQMFCRDGCRCEQQYRLHRLLAYDPHNECRGIFSDWFRFPSSCICKCYNIPMEFRATSRSPRSDSRSFDAPQQDPVEAAEAEVQRAIYDHATEEWYRPRDDFDFLEG
ncbi:protein spaetzle 4 [Drosophila guanche]|uniref:Blast:Disks large homolog 5 n=1 Tax=Drosophila guanche TaxID=7266 RepID=A0A3B0K7L5_DROGU|nr:protein spaetzle 4 [Drosophila guanche]SPP79518.1 blast:Disks large homolog 5 [Drosophila guanche]